MDDYADSSNTSYCYKYQERCLYHILFAELYHTLRQTVSDGYGGQEKHELNSIRLPVLQPEIIQKISNHIPFFQ
jgi:hypothetical protein